MTHILDLPGSFDELMRRKSTPLLMECEVKKLCSLSLDQSGNLLLKTNMSISKSCLLQWSYDPYDIPREFAGGFALIKKDKTSTKHPIHTESEWNQVFTAWKDGVIILYPHREFEL